MGEKKKTKRKKTKTKNNYHLMDQKSVRFMFFTVASISKNLSTKTFFYSQTQRL